MPPPVFRPGLPPRLLKEILQEARDVSKATSYLKQYNAFASCGIFSGDSHYQEV